jgi:hypothetical protein
VTSANSEQITEPPAHFLYETQALQEMVKLLRMLLSNCTVEAVSIYSTYRKPFGMIFERSNTGEWWALGNDLRTLEPQSDQPCLRLESWPGRAGTAACACH